jgi:hypothetical protein
MRGTPTGVVVGSRASGVSGSSLTVGEKLSPVSVACVETTSSPGGSAPTVAAQETVNDAPAARLTSRTTGTVSPGALPAAIIPAVEVTDPASRVR